MKLNYSLTCLPKRVEILPQTAEIDEFVVTALRYVIQHIFSNIANAFVVTISTAGTPVEFWFHDIMAQLFATWGFMAVQLVVRDSRQLADIEIAGRRFCNMVLVDSFESLENSKISVYNNNYDSMEYYFIFLQVPDSLMPLQRAKILKYCLDNYWLHCNVMIQNARGEVLIYTYFPFQEYGCYQTDPVLINQFDGKRFVNDIMFPNKLGNFHECPLKLTTRNMPPFVIYESNASEQELPGLEMVILRALSRMMNFTLNLDNTAIDGSQLPNETRSQRLWEKLQYRETNITAGFLPRSTDRDASATPSYMTYHLPLIPVIFRRPKADQIMRILTFPFDKYTWMLLVITSILLIVINSIIGTPDTRSYKRWQIVELLLGIATCRVPKDSSHRTIFICCILLSFVLRSLYQSRLFHLYRTHFYVIPPETLEAMIENHYIAVCTQRSEQFLSNVPEIRNNSLPLIVLDTANEMEPLRYIEKNIDKNMVAISVVDFVFVYAAKNLKRGNALILISAVLNNQQISFYFTKHTYLAEPFDEWILRFHQVGLIERWRYKSLASYKVSKRKTDVSVYEKQMMIDMKQILGFVIIISTLDLIAIIIFALEMMSKKLKFLQHVF